MKKLILTTLLLLIPSLNWGETLEKVIADANLYTVKIDVSTEMPFIEFLIKNLSKPTFH